MTLTEEELALVASGRRLDAIKSVKDRLGISALDAKKLVEASSHAPNLTGHTPVRPPSKVSKNRRAMHAVKAGHAKKSSNVGCRNTISLRAAACTIAFALPSFLGALLAVGLIGGLGLAMATACFEGAESMDRSSGRHFTILPILGFVIPVVAFGVASWTAGLVSSLVISPGIRFGGDKAGVMAGLVSLLSAIIAVAIVGRMGYCYVNAPRTELAGAVTVPPFNLLFAVIFGVIIFIGATICRSGVRVGLATFSSQEAARMFDMDATDSPNSGLGCLFHIAAVVVTLVGFYLSI